MDSLGSIFGLFIVGAIALGLLSALTGSGRRQSKAAPCYYDAQKGLLTPPEIAAFRQLVKALGGSAHVAPKVRIADILKVRSSGNRKIDGPAFNRISQKHVDFLIISYSGDILFAVEIDDKSHERSDRKKRDEFVNAAFQSARVELYRAAPGKLSENSELKERIRELRQSTALASAI